MKKIQVEREAKFRQQQGGMPNQAMGNQGMGNMAAMGMPGGMANNQPNGFGQNFPPQLQHQMQASPIPNNAQNLAAGMDPNNMAGAQQQLQQQTPQQQNTQLPPNMQRRPGPGPIMNPQINQQQIQHVAMMMKRRAETTHPQDLERARITINNMPAENRMQLQQRGIDPIMWFFQRQAQQHLLTMQRQASQGQQSQQGQQNQQPGNPAMPGGMAAAQKTPQQAMATPQNQANQAPAPDFNMGQFTDQQAEALRSQEAGQQVVPASNKGRLKDRLVVTLTVPIQAQHLGILLHAVTRPNYRPRLERKACCAVICALGKD